MTGWSIFLIKFTIYCIKHYRFICLADVSHHRCFCIVYFSSVEKLTSKAGMICFMKWVWELWLEYLKWLTVEWYVRQNARVPQLQVFIHGKGHLRAKLQLDKTKPNTHFKEAPSSSVTERERKIRHRIEMHCFNLAQPLCTCAIFTLIRIISLLPKNTLQCERVEALYCSSTLCEHTSILESIEHTQTQTHASTYTQTFTHTHTHKR